MAGIKVRDSPALLVEGEQRGLSKKRGKDVDKTGAKKGNKRGEEDLTCHATRPDSVAKLRTSVVLSNSATDPTVSACRKYPSKYAKISRNSVKFS